ncbi:MAG: RHS repeat-associated core domain-containing protein, partial [Phycisphaeraceae bacterium]|nr:RHS repeat-associated core domain-containing protein [Phycisphaeraceae bacterium]
DANKNVTALIAPGNGQPVERYLYDPYGRVMVLKENWSLQEVDGHDDGTVSAFGNEILFTGYRYNSETGTYHARNREYHPLLGRFMQRDPLGYVDGGNLYAGYFVMWGGVDPMGLEGEATTHTGTVTVSGRNLLLPRPVGDQFSGPQPGGSVRSSVRFPDIVIEFEVTVDCQNNAMAFNSVRVVNREAILRFMNRPLPDHFMHFVGVGRSALPDRTQGREINQTHLAARQGRFTSIKSVTIRIDGTLFHLPCRRASAQCGRPVFHVAAHANWETELQIREAYWRWGYKNRSGPVNNADVRMWRIDRNLDKDIDDFEVSLVAPANSTFVRRCECEQEIPRFIRRTNPEPLGLVQVVTIRANEFRDGGN